jgi:hypothetical protein
MVSLASLWLPVLVSAVLVFIASFLLHMVLPFHHGDYRRLPSEDEVMEALRRFDIPPGDYMVPCAGGPAGARSPEFRARLEKGPVATMTVMKPGPMNMGAYLAQWFVYLLVVGVFAGYVASRTLGPGAPYLQVFRFAGTTAFIGYALALWQDSIWYRRNWGTTIRYTIDGLIYGLLTAGTFGWLWPR